MTLTSRSLPRRKPVAACFALILVGGTIEVSEAGPAATASADISPVFPDAGYRLRQRIRARRNSEHAFPLKNRFASNSRATRTDGNDLIVTSCADDGSPGTLRSVVAGAAEHDTVDLSQLTCSTITLVEGPIDSSMLGDNGLYYLTIQGPGQDSLTIDGARTDQVFEGGGFSSAMGRLELDDLTVANGNDPHGLAGCIEVFGGTLALDHVTVTGCSASNGGPLTFGGAVDTSYLEMTSSTVSDSSSFATGDNVAIGGGAYASNDAVLVDSTISGNTVNAETAGDGTYYITAGGGLYVRGALTMTRSTVNGNEVSVVGDYASPNGGGVFVRDQTTISDSTFDDNSAGQGGGLFKAEFSRFGDPGTTLGITNSTFSGNSVYYNGGAILSERPTVITSSTIAANRSNRISGVACRGADCSLEIQSSIIAKNQSGDVFGSYWDIGADFGVDFTVAGANNLVTAAINVTLPPDTIIGDPLLLPLADNGGPTQTLALDPASPAIDAGNNDAMLDYDQRGPGFPRVSGAAADIGAYEREVDNDFIFSNGFDSEN